MLRKIFPILLILIGLLVVVRSGLAQTGGGTTLFLPLVTNSALKTPILKWQSGGCYSSWCETGWYSSPAVLDINNDGRNEVIASAYSLVALNGETGQLIWRAGTPANRTWPGIVVADIDLDGQKEIVTAQSGGLVSVYQKNGALKWQKQPASSHEFRGLLAADLDGNHSTLELVVTQASGSEKNTWVLDSAGNTRAGWPQLPNERGNSGGYAWGVYNANAAAADLNNDGKLELVVPSDVHYINMFEPDGTPVKANPVDYGNKNWGQVGIWENLTVEKRGWGACDGVRAESYRANFADGPATLADLNGDGKREVIVVGNMVDCAAGYPPSRYLAPFIFNPDRSRFNQPGADWRAAPVDTGAPLSEDYNVIETVADNPVTADLDGDGKQEILFSAYDGKVHAFWLDKTEHGSWPYSVTLPSSGIISFASEPLVADLNNDQKGEVIFTTWTQKGSYQSGKLIILSWDGQPLAEVNLPAPRSSTDTWNGGLGAPTLANIDGDPDLELIIQTAHSGVVAYDLPGTSQARILWGTGRGSFTRAGAP